MNKNKILKEFSKWLSNQITLPGVLRFFKGKIFLFIVKRCFDWIPRKVEADALTILRNITNGDIEKISTSIIKRVSKAVKTRMSDKKEQIIMNGVADTIFKLIKA